MNNDDHNDYNGEMKMVMLMMELMIFVMSKLKL